MIVIILEILIYFQVGRSAYTFTLFRPYYDVCYKRIYGCIAYKKVDVLLCFEAAG